MEGPEEIKRCGRCERKLKNPKYIELGYGKTCYQKIQEKKAEFERNQQQIFEEGK